MLPNSRLAPVRTSNLTEHRRYGVGVIAQVGRNEAPLAEIACMVETPQGGFQRVDNIAGTANLVPGLGLVCALRIGAISESKSPATGASNRILGRTRQRSKQ